jgi:hypothetical protein
MLPIVDRRQRGRREGERRGRER